MSTVIDVIQLTTSVTESKIKCGRTNVVSNVTSAAYTTCSDIDDDSERKQHDVTVAMAAINQTNELSTADIFRMVCLWVLFLVGFVGNMFVLILVVWRRSRKQAVVQLLMCSMATCDIGMVTIAWIYFAVTPLLQSWIFGSFVCKFLTYAQPMSGDGSMWIIATISIDRALGMSRPEGNFFSFRSGVQVLTFVWLALCAINVPLFLMTDTVVTVAPNRVTNVHCVPMLYMDPASRSIYWIIGRVLVFLVPLSVSFLSYAAIYCRMKRAHTKVAPSEGHRWSETNDQQQNQQHLSATRKIGQMCFMVASAFTLLWTPLQLLLVARFAGIESVTADKIMTVYLLPCLNSCINPLIYGLAWKPLRQTFREVSYICVVSLTLCCIAFFFILTFQFWVLISLN